MTPDSEPCPCESHVPPGAPGRVDDSEFVFRTIRIKANDLVFDDSGIAQLSPLVFKSDELKGNSGGVSLVRAIASRDKIQQITSRINQNIEWLQDPVVASSSVESLRSLYDDNERRIICVNATPRPENCYHASLLRSSPAPDEKSRMEWQKIKMLLIKAFADVRHLSGASVSK